MRDFQLTRNYFSAHHGDRTYSDISWCDTVRYGAKWTLAMVIGAYTYAIGLGFPFGLRYNPDSEEIYGITVYLFIVLSPCAFIAVNYILLERLARHISCVMHILLPVQQLTRTFVSSDIITFLIQAMEGGIVTSQDRHQRLVGSHIFLAGLVLQLTTFTLFTGIWVPDEEQSWCGDWRALAGALFLSCIGILASDGYRSPTIWL